MLTKRHLFAIVAASASLVGGSLAVATPGSLDTEVSLPSFNNNDIKAIAIDGDDRAILVGSFTDVGDRIAAMLPDGTLDPAFNPGSGFNSGCRAVAVGANNVLYVGGDFTEFNDVSRAGIARLLEDGSLDTSFDPGTGFTGSVYRVLPLASGEVLVAGGFYQVQGESIIGIVQLNADGTLDDTFGVTTGTNNVVNDLVQLADGRILLGGAFTAYNGTPRNRIAVLKADGTLDETVDFGSGFNGTVTELELLSSGKILVAGSFSSYNGSARQRLALLNDDGTLDESFDGGAGPNSTVNAMVQESGGRVVIAGSFTTVDGVSRSRIARLLPNGALDLEFDPGAGASSTVNTVVDLAGQDRLLIGGVFTSYDTEFTGRLARVIGGGYEATSSGFPEWIASFYPDAGGDQEIVGVDADPDADGVPNLLEYAFEGNPVEASRDGLPVSTISDVEGQSHLAISFARVRDVADITYSVEMSPDLSTWTEIWNSDNSPYEGDEAVTMKTVVDTQPMDAAGSRFLRVSVLREDGV